MENTTIQKYTTTDEGREVLRMLGYTISTKHMEVYKCNVCEELFAGDPNIVEDEDELPICGICEHEHHQQIKAGLTARGNHRII